MKDITSFVAKTNINESIHHVYVHEKEGVKYAVATDSFKLIEYKVPERFIKILENGFYSIKKWKALCKISKGVLTTDKRKDFLLIVEESKLVEQSHLTFPNYNKIVPEVKDLGVFRPDSTLTREHLIAFLNMLPDEKFGRVSFSDIKQTERGKSIMTYFKNDDIMVLLMNALE
jgi:hypothetical protein